MNRDILIGKVKGDNAKINGYDTITLAGGPHIELTHEDENFYVGINDIGEPNGLAELDENGEIPIERFPDSVMRSNNPVGTGSFSMNRKADSTVGTNSVAVGYNTTASGSASHAEGGHTIASSKYQHVQGRWNLEDTNNVYAHIIGNGYFDPEAPEGEQEVRSNAMTVDWDGNGTFAGDVLVNDGSLSVNQIKTDLDDLAEKVEREKYVHPAGSAPNKAVGLYKISTDDTSHVKSTTAVVKSDITALGIPAQDTTYTSKAAASGGTDVSLVTTGEKYNWNNKGSGSVTSVTIKATSPISIDSSAAITTTGTRTISHANSGVTAGTYKSVTVNATGHITSGSNPTTLAGYGITDAVPNSRTVNGKALSSNITLNATDVNAVSTAANQGLTSTEQSNARANIAAAASSHTHDDRYYTETEMDTKLSNKMDKINPVGSGTLTFTGTGDFSSDIKLGRYLQASVIPESATGNSYIRILPFIPYSKIDETHTPAVYLKELCKWICANYPNEENIIFIGRCRPNTIDTVIVKMYDTNQVDSNGYPENAGGILAKGTNTGDLISFGFSNYTWSCKTVSYSDHIHDDRYYTETEMDTKLAGKAASSHTHTPSEVGLGNVGNFKAVSTVASQGLSSTEQSNARANIGAMSNVDATGTGSLSINRKAGTVVGINSIAVGYNTTASGIYSHAEGMITTASGLESHAEGYHTTASGNYSHAEGAETSATNESSHAEGTGTIASSKNQHVQGRWNLADANDVYAHIIGNGSNASNRSDAFRVEWTGNGWFAGDVTDGSGNVLSNKANISHTHSYAGSSSEGGAATSALTCTGNSATATSASTTTPATASLKNIYAGTDAMTSGSTPLATGTIYLQYE